MSIESFETFRKIDAHEKRQIAKDEPSCFNGMVRVRKYKITTELVDEPIEVIQARIQKMWDECTNHHNWNSLQKEAAKYGLTLCHSTRQSQY